VPSLRLLTLSAIACAAQLLSGDRALAQPNAAPEGPPAKPNGVVPPTPPAALPTVAAHPVPPAAVPAPTIAPLRPPASVPPPSAHGGVMSTRVAITEFKVDGDGASPALSMQLQDGFVVGVTRTAPIYVLDSVDVARYMTSFPELQKCDGSICVKRFGQLLDVSHLIRVSVKVTGNSYTMTARLLSTEEPTPAIVPVDAETRFCNVCTADEARQKMIQLGDEVKRPVESWLAAWRPPPPPPPPPKSWRRPVAAVGVALGFATAAAGGALFANADDSRWKAGTAGLLVGLGLGGTLVGCYVLIALPSEPGKTPASLAVGGKF
jgi:hypothetical protein